MKGSCSVVSSSLTPCTVACQAPSSVGFSRQEHWSGLPFSRPRDQTQVSRTAGRLFTVGATFDVSLCCVSECKKQDSKLVLFDIIYIIAKVKCIYICKKHLSYFTEYIINEYIRKYGR